VSDDTDAARAELAWQQAEGVHNPASECPLCGTVRTPGQTHTRGDDLPSPRPVRPSNQCNG
jgi:hypothetical protein